jgi:hypothetical protein
MTSTPSTVAASSSSSRVRSERRRSSPVAHQPPQHLQFDAWDPDAVESVAQNGQAGARE